MDELPELPPCLEDPPLPLARFLDSSSLAMSLCNCWIGLDWIGLDNTVAFVAHANALVNTSRTAVSFFGGEGGKRGPIHQGPIGHETKHGNIANETDHMDNGSGWRRKGRTGCGMMERGREEKRREEKRKRRTIADF